MKDNSMNQKLIDSEIAGRQAMNGSAVSESGLLKGINTSQRTTIKNSDFDNFQRSVS